MRIITIFLLIINLNAQAEKLKKYCKPAKCSSKNFVIDLPVTIIDNTFIIDGVRVNNSTETYCFMFDTGASTSCISRSLAESTGIKATLIDSMSDGVRKTQSDYSFCNLSFSGLKFDRVGVCILSDEKIDIRKFCSKIDGIIGYNIMRNFVWQFKDGQVIISDRIKNLSEVGNLQNDKISNGSIPLIVGGYKNGYRATMLFDLGDNGSLEVNTRMLKYLRSKKIEKGTGSIATTLIGDVSNESSMQVVQTPGFFIGNDTLFNPISYVGEASFSVIGAGILNYYNMTFDFPKRDLYSKLKKENFDDSEFTNYGFKIKVDNGEVFVRFVWNNSDAYKMGIRHGQKLLQIENFPLTNLEYKKTCEIYEEINAIIRLTNPKNRIRVRVEGVSKPIELKKQKLFRTLTN